jgi:hypothetical protein
VEQIAKESHIPVESLPDDFNHPVFLRGRTILGFVGDQFDQIARDYDNMQWWVSDSGLNMAIVIPAAPPRLPMFDELMDGPTPPEPAENRKRPRKGKTDPTVQRIKKKVRELKKEGLDYRSICDRLGSRERPPRAGWRDLPWPRAYQKHTSAVTKWLSEACSDTHS